jgi:N6-L-threonylcarbamoyladenine synthase
MRILAIETSCDETSAAIIEGQGKSLKLIKNTVATSINLHKDTGGIIPENAAREQLKYILPVLSETTDDFESLDAIAVTYGPGLIGSLLVGVETAKTLSFVFNKPLIPVNHLIGHVYANWLDQKREIEFPALGLIVSGGHTDLILGLPYPGGPAIEKAAREGNPKAINLPRPMIDSDNFDFSFSGLKAATLRTVQANKLNDKLVSDIAASVQQAIVDVILSKTIKAAKKFKVKSILLGGGVAANSKLRDELEAKNDIPLFTPPKSLCTDNAAMIGAAAYFYFEPRSWQKIEAMPELYFGV